MTQPQPQIEVPAVGPLDAQVVFVGEAPASEEFRSKTPFVGEAGQRLRKYCTYASLDLDPIRITNVSKERAPGYKIMNMPQDRRSYWQGALIQEINDMPNPKILVALGNFATQTLTGRTGISKLRGSPMKPVKAIKHDCVVIPTYHPASIGYGNYENWIYIVADLVRVKRLVDNNCKFEFPTFSFTIRPTLKQVLERLEWMEEHPSQMYTLDVETPHGLLSCIGMAWNKREAICIPFFNGNGTNYWTESEEILIWQTLGRVLPKLNINNQTWMFDWQIMLEHRIKMKTPQWDPMMMHHCLYSTMKHTLDMITSLYTDIAYYKSDTRDDKGVRGSVLRAGMEGEHWEYNCLDCVAAWWAIKELEKELIEENMMETYQHLYVDVYEVMFHMNMTGAPIGMKELEEHRELLNTENNQLAEKLDALYREHLNKNKDKIKKQITRKIGKKNKDEKLELDKSKRQYQKELEKAMNKKFLPNSSAMAKELYIDFMGMKGYIDKKSGNISMKEENLEKLSHKYKVESPLWIVRYRKNAKELALFSDENIPDGRIRTRYSPRTGTGRLSARKSFHGIGMNLQNVKRGETRRFFVAEEGEILLEADQKQAEAKIVAWLSQDLKLIEIAESGRFHLQNMENVFGIPGDKKHPLYTLTKSIGHGANYGMGEYQLGLIAHILTSEAREHLQLYHSIYPGIKNNFHAFVKREINTNRMLYNPFGRRQTFFGQLNRDTYKKGYAFIPQSTITDINKIALKKVSKFKFPLLDTHDGILLSVPRDKVEEGIRVLKEAYNTPFKIWSQTHVIDVEIKIGENWYDMKEVE